METFSRLNLLILIVYIAQGCNCNNSNTSNTQYNKPVDSTIIAERLWRDSVLTEKSKIAYAGLKFGISVKEALKTGMFYGDGSYDSTTDRLSFAFEKQQVGKYRYNIEAFFHNDSLYKIGFSSYYQNASYLDTDIKNYVQNLYNVISENYGDPEYLGTPSIFDFDPGYISWIYRWRIMDKVIVIGMSENISGSTYNAVAQIYNREVANRLRIEREKKEAELTKKGSENF